MKKLFTKRWHGIPVAIATAILLVMALAGIAIAQGDFNFYTATATVTIEGSGAYPYYYIPPTTTPPVISELSAGNVSQDSADISWTTDEPSTSQVEYSSGPPQFTPLDSTLVTNHLVHLSGLVDGTTYYFIAYSGNAAGNIAVSTTGQFTTISQPTLTLTPSPTPTTPSAPTPTPTPPLGEGASGIPGWALPTGIVLLVVTIAAYILNRRKPKKGGEV